MTILSLINQMEVILWMRLIKLSIHYCMSVMNEQSQLIWLLIKMEKQCGPHKKTMAELFNVSKSTISEHLKHIFEEGELNKNSTVRKIRTVQIQL